MCGRVCWLFELLRNIDLRLKFVRAIVYFKGQKKPSLASIIREILEGAVEGFFAIELVLNTSSVNIMTSGPFTSGFLNRDVLTFDIILCTVVNLLSVNCEQRIS